MDGNTRAIVQPDALFTEMDDGEAVVLNLETHAYYGLNRTGTRIWQLIAQGKRMNEILLQLKEEFEAGDQELRDAVDEYVQELVANRLIRLTD